MRQTEPNGKKQYGGGSILRHKMARHLTIILWLPFLTGFFVISCQDEVASDPRLNIYTMDSTILPIFVYVDDSCIGILRQIPVLTRQVNDGSMIPSFQSAGTVSVEVAEGMHTVVATKDFLSASQVPENYRSNLQDGLTFVQLKWEKELDTKKGIEYPLRIGHYNDSLGDDAVSIIPTILF